MERLFVHIAAARQMLANGGQGSSGQTTDPSKGPNSDLPHYNSSGSEGASNDPNEGELVDSNSSGDSSMPADPSAFEHLFVGELGGQLENLLTMSDNQFDKLVEQGSIDSDYRFTLSGEPVWGTGDDRRSLDLLAAGHPAAAYRQTSFFEVEAVPGDGVVVVDFWIGDDVSGPIIPFLAGDGRGYVDPLSGHLDLDDSRVTVIIDRENGRAMVTVSPTTIRTIDYPGSIESWLTDPLFQKGNEYTDHITVPARPIVLGPNPGLTSGVHDNYFQVISDGSTIRLDYDSINSVTAAGHVISVDGPIIIEHGDDGTFQVGEGHDPDNYPSIAVVQYLPDGSQQVVYQHDNEPVVPGAIGDKGPWPDPNATPTPEPTSGPVPVPNPGPVDVSQPPVTTPAPPVTTPTPPTVDNPSPIQTPQPGNVVEPPVTPSTENSAGPTPEPVPNPGPVPEPERTATPE